MKGISFILFLGVLLSMGCARIKVEGSQKPIKVDVSMRLDVYQHVQKDIDAIEDIVSGPKEKTDNSNSDGQSLLSYIIPCAYAQEELSPELKQAVLRRKERLPELSSWEGKGIIGENKSGLIEIKGDNVANTSLQRLVKTENDDRMIIYNLLAEKNNTSISAIQEMYAKRLQEDAPAGTPIEVLNTATGSCEWKVR